ncbi:hypothetical protein C8R46DRAFT_1256296 [Mycena filopes]|nr:hypothetical protein C8R46DRAFT_1256296 [Mycena filopes]
MLNTSPDSPIQTQSSGPRAPAGGSRGLYTQLQSVETLFDPKPDKWRAQNTAQYDAVITDATGSDWTPGNIRDTMQRYDILLGYLLGICRESGVELKFCVEVASVQICSQHRPIIVTTTGETIKADVLVGADGHNSVVRNSIRQEELDEDTDIVDSMSDDKSVPLSHNFTELVSMVRTNGAGLAEVESDWHPENPPAMSEEEKRSWDAQEPRIKRLISMASTWHRSIQRIPKSCQLTDPATGLVIIGDAAHAVPATTNHKNSQVEDGFALGRIFSHLTSRDQIPALLQGYHATRYNRTIAAESSELGAMATATLPPGPARTARDHGLKAMSLLDNESESVDEVVAAVWSTYLVQFNYDATEAVDEWWLNWGRLTKREDFAVVE